MVMSKSTAGLLAGWGQNSHVASPRSVGSVNGSSTDASAFEADRFALSVCADRELVLEPPAVAVNAARRAVLTERVELVVHACERFR